MLVKTFGSALNGIEAITVTIEVNIDRGVQFFLVGLPDSAVKESQQRIEAALTGRYKKRRLVVRPSHRHCHISSLGAGKHRTS